MDLFAWLVIGAFAALMLGLGLVAHLLEVRAGRDAEGFWTAHFSLSGWSLGMSLSASMLSVSWSLVYGVELFYRYGWGGVWLLGVPWLCVLALFFWLAPRLRSFGAFSQGELFGKVYGTQLQLITAVVLSAVFLAWCGAEIAAASAMLAPTLGVLPQTVMLLLALVVASYSWAGGFRAVVLTDVAQFLLIVLFFAYLGGKAFLGSVPFTALAVPGPSWELVLTTLSVYITGWLAEADIWLRLTAAKDHAHARLAMGFTFGVSLLLVVLFPAALAAVARARFPDPRAVAGPVLEALLAALLPPTAKVVLLGGVAAVALSTVSTTANVVAVTWARDWPRKRRTSSESLASARWASALAVAAALLVALASRSLAELFYLSGGLLSAGLFWPTLGLFWEKLRKPAQRAARVGLFAVVLAFALERSGTVRFVADPGLAELGIGYIPPALAVGAVTFAGSLLRKPRREALRQKACR
jgi:Na+/proline symporter